MHDTERAVTVLDGIHQHADGDDVVDLAEFLLAADHLLVDAVRVLGASGDLRLHAEWRELACEDLGHVAHEGVPLLMVARQPRFDQVVVVRIQLHERKVLELSLDFPDTEAMRERRVDVERFAADAQPALGGVPVDGAHVVEPVTELDEHHAHVLRHGDEHLADVLGLVRLGAAHVDLAELGHAVNELGDLVTEEAAHLLAGDLGVLHRVVEQRGHERLGVEPQVGEDTRDGEGMLDVRLAREPRLSGVGAVGHIEGAPDRGLILLREVLHAGHELGNRHGLYECRARAVRSNTM
jgi:hypothetical protein